MACSCVTGLGNTGLPSCLPLNEIPVGFLFQQTYDSTGTRNNLLGASIGTATYLTALTQNTDKTVRLYPVQNIAEAVSERGDSTNYTDSLGVNHFIKEGERTYVGEKTTNAAPKLVGQMDLMKCNQMSVYVVGHEGGIFGVSTTVGELEGYEIVKGSIDARWVTMTAAKIAHMPLSFSIAATTKDENIMKFDAGDITDDAQLLSGMIDISSVIDGTVTTSVFTVDITADDYGTAKAATTIEGLVAADFVLTETAPTPGVTTITSVAESSAGKYLFTVTTTSADVNDLTLSSTGTAKGYEMTTLEVTTP